ncbi:hypothetical protein IT570_05255 [Candidatus Sumerlaeota bacterium]|nr:hypothetical protein [Candidatus Sumerlaeota bacterium]
MKIKHILPFSLPVLAALLITAGVRAQDEPVPTPAASEPADASTPSVGSEPSISDLEQLMNLPQASAIKEYEEDTKKPKSLFDSPGAIERIFSKTKPTFIYFPEGADPMIIPWERERVIAQELFQEATSAIANRDYKKAVDKLKEIREKYPNTEEGQKAPTEIDKVNDLIKSIEQPAGTTTAVLPPDAGPDPLPEWIRKNTSAVLITSNPTVMVGNDFLREGDAVPRYAGVKVKTITESEVIYLYQDKEYPVAVEGSF